MNEMAFRVTSNDGTTIAYDRKGSGPAVVLVGGAQDDGAENAPLIPALAEHFTVYNYARRGRGASGFTEPYAVEREIEDLDALIAEAGGSAHLFGASSGGALALEAAAAGSAIDTIAVWEVPYAVGDDIRPRFEEYVADTRRAFDAGRDEEVLELFMRMTGASDDNIAARKAAGKQTAHWADSVALAPTLVHDSVFHNRYQLPADRLATVTQPVLVTTGGPITVPYMAGLPSDFFDRAADELADLLPHAQRETLEGPDHVVDPQIVLVGGETVVGRLRHCLGEIADQLVALGAGLMLVADERTHQEVDENPPCVAEVLAGRVEVVRESERLLPADLVRAALLRRAVVVALADGTTGARA